MQLFFFTNPANLKSMNLIWKNLVFSHFLAPTLQLVSQIYPWHFTTVVLFTTMKHQGDTTERNLRQKLPTADLQIGNRDAQDVAVNSSGNQWSGAQYLWQPLLCLATVSSSKLLRRRYLLGRHNPLNPIINSIYNSYIAKCTLININQCWYYL